MGGFPWRTRRLQGEHPARIAVAQGWFPLPRAPPRRSDAFRARARNPPVVFGRWVTDLPRAGTDTAVTVRDGNEMHCGLCGVRAPLLLLLYTPVRYIEAIHSVLLLTLASIYIWICVCILPSPKNGKHCDRVLLVLLLL